MSPLASRARANAAWMPATASRGGGRAHRLFHPLCGATLDTLIPLLCKGGVAPRRSHVAAIALAMAVLRLPFTAAEAAGVAMLRPGTRRALPAPLFIVGHWRSGTTHLANLLSQSPDFGILSPMSVGLPAEALGLARLARPFVEQFFPRARLIDAMPLRRDLPQEDELAIANLSTLSCNHGLYFPARLQQEFARGLFGDGVHQAEQARWARRLRRYVDKMTWAEGGRPLLIRNPAHSGHIPALRKLWPDARFIHIHRDPVEVCASSARVFATLLRELSMGRVAAPDTLAAELVRTTYPRLMQTLRRDTASLPPDRFVELRYENLQARPIQELERAYAALGLSFDRARPAITAYVAASRPHAPSRADDREPARHWLRQHTAIFDHWNYALP